ncbi:hypothetical protein [Kangiella shandongensis]|uniref:hypothetical protein n=1 Tax=Kangiella shandongensis TaxID=2763258 RepID=UPI001CBF2EC7|nr:hypothetical protein [Kangiella shandongensis]
MIQTLAVWGAITGTIGTLTGVISLFLRYKAHKRDNPKLKCQSIFSFEHSSGIARAKHKVVIRSVGRRPVSIDYIRYYVKPERMHHYILRWYFWAHGKWVYDQKPKHSINLTEGKKEAILISLPNVFPLGDVIKVKVFDQAGTSWRVSWYSLRKLKFLIRNEPLDQIEESNSRQNCKVLGYLAGESFYLSVSWNKKPGQNDVFLSKNFKFKNHDEYSKKLQCIEESQIQKFLNEEIKQFH